jgi:predicted nuclease of restriction endonuclease-like RecB superfamily
LLDEMKVLAGQVHLLSEVRMKVFMQVVQVLASEHTLQLGPQAAQYLTPSVETVKKVLLGQEQEPSLLGVANATHEVQLVADRQIPHPLLQGWQVLLVSG